MAALDATPTPAQTTEITPSPAGNDWMQMREEWSQLRKQLMTVLKPQSVDVGLLTPANRWCWTI